MLTKDQAVLAMEEFHNQFTFAIKEGEIEKNLKKYFRECFINGLNSDVSINAENPPRYYFEIWWGENKNNILFASAVISKTTQQNLPSSEKGLLLALNKCAITPKAF